MTKVEKPIWTNFRSVVRYYTRMDKFGPRMENTRQQLCACDITLFGLQLGS